MERVTRVGRLLVAVVCCVWLGVAHGAPPLEETLVERVDKASRALNKTQADITEKKTAYQRRLGEKEQQIKALRNEAAKLQRAADEQLLGLDKLESRVERWETQSKYQQHLLSNYLSFIASSPSELGGASGADLVEREALELAYQRLQGATQPQWKSGEIIAGNGRVKDMALIRLGPVELAYDPAAGEGGFVNRDRPEQPRLMKALVGRHLNELGRLRNEGRGELYFDPTLGNAFKIENQQSSAWDLLRTGGMWAVPIVFFGALSLIISLLKGVQLLRLPRVDGDLAQTIQTHVARSDNSTHSDPEQLLAQLQGNGKQRAPAQQRMVEIAARTPVSQQRDDLLVAHLMETKHRLERFMGVVATSAAVAPLLGLLGTVSGMISTFKMMTIFGSGDPSTVSGGISEALITTELGLIVAIPSLIVSALLTRRVKSYTHSLEAFAIKLSKIDFNGAGRRAVTAQ